MSVYLPSSSVLHSKVAAKKLVGPDRERPPFPEMLSECAHGVTL